MFKLAQKPNHKISFLLINWNQNYNREKTFLKIQPSSLSGQVGFLKKLISRLNFIVKY